MAAVSGPAVLFVALGAAGATSRTIGGTATFRFVPAGQAAAPSRSAEEVQFERTHWRAVELAGKPVPPQDANHEPHLVFRRNGRVAGSDGCNRVTGRYKRSGSAMKFGQMAVTRMACPDTTEIERAFQQALESTASLQIAGDRLELFDAAGTRLAAFAARRDDRDVEKLEGTTWQLVRFEGGNDVVLMPGDPSRYTIEFGTDGRLTARIDCNRGRGAWKSTEPNLIELEPLALTRAQCPEGSLHDQIVKHWPYIRSYVLRDGHLFLALMADGGIYEFEPVRPPR